MVCVVSCIEIQILKTLVMVIYLNQLNFSQLCLNAVFVCCETESVFFCYDAEFTHHSVSGKLMRHYLIPHHIALTDLLDELILRFL